MEQRSGAAECNETLFNGQEIYKKDIFYEGLEHIAAETL